MTFISIVGYFPIANLHREYVKEIHILRVLLFIQTALQKSYIKQLWQFSLLRNLESESEVCNEEWLKTGQ